MKNTCKALTCLFLLCCAKVTSAAALPATISTINTNLVQLSNASLAGPNILTSRKIVLAFDSVGQDIPEREVVATLRSAERAISSLVQNLPDQLITNDQFEYRREDGNMLIVISASFEQEITWGDLARVLEALDRFMTGGVGVPHEHYHALEFRIESASRMTIGNGLVWYFPPKTKVQKRDVPSSGAIVSNAVLQLPTTTAPVTSKAEIRYPVPNTSDTLIFTDFGTAIPRRIVDEALFLCLAQVDDHVRTEIFSPLPEKEYQFTWHGLTIMFSCHGVLHEDDVISWGQLRDILDGLDEFVRGETPQSPRRQSHYRALEFFVDVQYFGRVVRGSLFYDRPTTIESTEGTSNDSLAGAGQGNSKGTGLTQNTSMTEKRTPNTMVASPNVTFPIGRTPISIPGTPITIFISSLGNLIPSFEVGAALANALRTIQPSVRGHADMQIPNQTFWFRDRISNIWFLLMSSSGRIITWEQLSWTMAGLLTWMKGDHC